MAKPNSDEAKALDELSPYEIFEYAIYCSVFDPYGSPHYKEPYRRYRTLAHAKVAAKGLRNTYHVDITFYKFNFQTEEWEEFNG